MQCGVEAGVFCYARVKRFNFVSSCTIEGREVGTGGDSGKAVPVGQAQQLRSLGCMR
jgi:hypothetical protein